MAKRILVVDDTFEDLNTAKEVLEHEGYEIVIATGGEQAIEIIQSGGHFDLLLINIMMPKISGYDLVKTIREKLKNHTKIIYVSIVPEKEAKMDGVDGFVQKPYSPEDLIKGVKKALEV